MVLTLIRKVFGMILTHKRHGTSLLLWKIYRYTVCYQTFSSSHIYVFTCQSSYYDNHLLPILLKGSRGDRKCLLSCVSTPLHFSLALRLVIPCPPQVVLQEKHPFLQECKNFWDCCSAMHRVFQMMSTLVLSQMVILCVSRLVLSQIWGTKIIPFMNSTTLLVPPMARCPTHSLVTVFRTWWWGVQ